VQDSISSVVLKFNLKKYYLGACLRIRTAEGSRDCDHEPSDTKKISEFLKKLRDYGVP
jgi:hypothetical protein